MGKLRAKSWLWLTRGWGRKGKARPTIGVLTFEVSRLISKTINLWHALDEERIALLRDETLRLQGVRKLVSDEEDFLLSLALAEIMDSVHLLARAVTRLGAHCVDPVLQRFEHVFADLIKNDSDLCGFEYNNRKKMDREVKKMERFVAASANLYQELEMLAELENDLKRMQAIPEMSRQGCNMGVFKKRVSLQRKDVKNLQDVSVWNQTYDFVARILARAVFTIVAKIKLVFGFQRRDDASGPKTRGQISRIYYSVSGLLHSSLLHSDVRGTTRRRFASGPLMGNGAGTTNRLRRGILAQIQLTNHRRSSIPKWSVSDSNFKGLMDKTYNSSPLTATMGRDGIEGDESTEPEKANIFNMNLSLGLFESRRKLLNAPPSTLGCAALALQYANIIIVIEKLAESPNSIGAEVRDELYSMLPRSIKVALRTRLSSYAKNLSSSVYDPSLAEEWSDAMARILEWLSPLAHNMIKWQSDRNFEKQQHLISSTNVLLLQTLYYANQGKAEAAITELLVGLNYSWRYGRELNVKAAIHGVRAMNLMNVVG